MGNNILHFGVLPSTNSYLKELIKAKEVEEGLTVITDYQTSGRGQFGNNWEAEKGKNLLMSIYLKPKFLKADEQFFLNMSVCLALVDTLNAYTQGFRIKWPNDILFDRKKIAGILIENFISGAHIESSIVGIGLNINQTQFGNTQSTSLVKVLNREWVVKDVLESFSANFEKRYEALKKLPYELKAEYFSYLYGFQEPVPIEVEGEKKTAILRGVQDSGQLLAEVDGKHTVFNYKELKFILG